MPGVDPQVPHILWIEKEENWDDWLWQGWVWVQPKKDRTIYQPHGIQSLADPAKALVDMICLCVCRIFGVAQTVFLVNRVSVPCQKGAVLTKKAKKWRICILPTENKGFFALQTPENDENCENGGCHSGKGMV